MEDYDGRKPAKIVRLVDTSKVKKSRTPNIELWRFNITSCISYRYSFTEIRSPWALLATVIARAPKFESKNRFSELKADI